MKLMRMLAIAALLAASPLAYGQETDLMSVNVPFAFTVGGVSMPAGRYVISRSQQGNLLKLRTFGHMDVFVPVTWASLSKAPASSSLVFDRDAKGYTLRQIDRQAEFDSAKIVDKSPAKSHEAPVQQVATTAAPAR